MRVRRLGWAGVEIEAGGERLVIDYVRDLSPLFTGWKPGQWLAAPSGKVTAALVTHLHRDHTDAPALADVLTPGAPVLRPAPGHGDDVDNMTTLLAESELAQHQLAVEVVDAWSTRDAGPRPRRSSTPGTRCRSTTSRSSPTRSQVTSRSATRRTNGARTPDGAHTCWPSGNGWT
ncbi:MBL fold metallo-hydrolase [Streptomyces aureocirculatus]|uniref:MBL fold metallo-hydrolase n=1 Tax=Streptomyces aureocirculatus TaxID=67275 RepID=UPI000AA3CF53|nr:MBL fold metallo-hydrolase [Streptomyces aureocirculatus]